MAEAHHHRHRDDDRSSSGYCTTIGCKGIRRAAPADAEVLAPLTLLDRDRAWLECRRERGLYPAWKFSLTCLDRVARRAGAAARGTRETPMPPSIRAALRIPFGLGDWGRGNRRVGRRRGGQARTNRAVVAFTLGGDLTANASGGLRTSVLQKVELGLPNSGRFSGLSLGCKFYPRCTPVLDWALGSLKFRLDRTGASIGYGASTQPVYIAGGFGLISSGLTATLVPGAGAECVHALSVSLQEPRIRAPAQRPSRPMTDHLARGAEGGPKPPSKEIAIVGGHWIDPGCDTGAPGEREVNLHIANRLTSKLSSRGWVVWRPENNEEKGEYTWAQYLDWVGDKTVRGVPVIEIHGQGKVGKVPALGVIGDHKAPLNAALGRDFGLFPMDFRLRGVSRHGGAIVEAFDTDDFREMTPIQRYVAAEKVSQVIADHVCSVAGGAEGSLQGCSPTGCPNDQDFLQAREIKAKTY